MFLNAIKKLSILYFQLILCFHTLSQFSASKRVEAFSGPALCVTFAAGVEEEGVSSSGERRSRWVETLQKHGDPVRLSSAGSQVYPQLLLRLRHEERVRLWLVSVPKQSSYFLPQIFAGVEIGCCWVINIRGCILKLFWEIPVMMLIGHLVPQDCEDLFNNG